MNRFFFFTAFFCAVVTVVTSFQFSVTKPSTFIRHSAHAAPTDSPESLQTMVDRALEGLGKKKRLSLLGSTGSIGTQTLDICREKPNQFECVAMAAGGNLDLLAQQIAEFKPKIVSIRESKQIDELRSKLRSLGVSDSAMPTLAHGDDGILAVATYPDAECVVTGIVGCAGLLPTVAAIKAGKDIALANKETLIAGGPVVVPLLAKHNVKMIPADSEHSAIFQCLQVIMCSNKSKNKWPKRTISSVKSCLIVENRAYIYHCICSSRRAFLRGLFVASF